jgi:hypothetical protein
MLPIRDFVSRHQRPSAHADIGAVGDPCGPKMLGSSPPLNQQRVQIRIQTPDSTAEVAMAAAHVARKTPNADAELNNGPA